jgi:hypothetical protein
VFLGFIDDLGNLFPRFVVRGKQFAELLLGSNEIFDPEVLAQTL